MVSASMRMFAEIVTFAAVVAQLAAPAAPRRGRAAAASPLRRTAPRPAARVVARKYGAMGTEITLSAWTDDERRRRPRVRGRLRRDPAHRDPDDRLGAPRRAGERRRPHQQGRRQGSRSSVSAETFEVIEKSLEMSRRSERRVRHHVRGDEGPLEVRRGSGEEGPARRRDRAPPQADQLARRRRRREGAHGEAAARRHAPGPGRHREGLRRRSLRRRAARRGAARLHGAGGRRSLRRRAARGPSTGWSGVRDPRGGPRDIIARMPIKDHAFSTAGDYERVVHPRRQALPPHHRSRDRLPGDRVARGDDLRADRVPRRRARRRGVHPRARRRGWRWSIRTRTARR